MTDTFSTIMYQIKTFNKNPKKNSTRLRSIKRQMDLLEQRHKIDKYSFIYRKLEEEQFDILCQMYDNMNENQLQVLRNYVFIH